MTALYNKDSDSTTSSSDESLDETSRRSVRDLKAERRVERARVMAVKTTISVLQQQLLDESMTGKARKKLKKKLRAKQKKLEKAQEERADACKARMAVYQAAQKKKRELDAIRKAFMSDVIDGNASAVRETIEKGKVKIDKANYGEHKHYFWQGNYPALALAAYHGRLDVVKTLLELGANINIGTPHKGTPLHIACMQGHNDIGKFLLLNDANPNIPKTAGCGYPVCQARSAEGRTLLMELAYLWNVKFVQLLLKEKSVDINAVSKEGMTALDYAKEKKRFDGRNHHAARREQVIRILVDHGALEGKALLPLCKPPKSATKVSTGAHRKKQGGGKKNGEETAAAPGSI